MKNCNFFHALQGGWLRNPARQSVNSERSAQSGHGSPAWLGPRIPVLSRVRPPRIRPWNSESQLCCPILTKAFGRAYCLLVLKGRFNPMAYFELQPADWELQQLAEQYWQEAGAREQQLEKAAYEAGEAIRGGEYTLPNLETIVRWKSERAVHYLIGNSSENIKSALAIAASPETKTEDAVNALVALRGVDISIASAILATIYPDRYAVLDYRALEALGHARHNVEFYAEYNATCHRMAECGMVKPQENLPGPTAMHALERALWQWSRSRWQG